MNSAHNQNVASISKQRKYYDSIKKYLELHIYIWFYKTLYDIKCTNPEGLLTWF